MISEGVARHSRTPTHKCASARVSYFLCSLGDTSRPDIAVRVLEENVARKGWYCIQFNAGAMCVGDFLIRPRMRLRFGELCQGKRSPVLVFIWNAHTFGIIQRIPLWTFWRKDTRDMLRITMTRTKFSFRVWRYYCLGTNKNVFLSKV